MADRLRGRSSAGRRGQRSRDIGDAVLRSLKAFAYLLDALRPAAGVPRIRSRMEGSLDAVVGICCVELAPFSLRRGDRL